MSGSAARVGGCLCGAVRFTASPKSDEHGACHCGMCRRWSAGPFMAVACGDTVKFVNEENVGVYRSSSWAERGFCTVCGSVLFYRTVGTMHHFVSVEAFNDADGFMFTREVFIDEKPPRYDFANDTQKMASSEVFAAFARSQGGADG